MKIAAFYSDSPFAGWVQCEGFTDVLRRMGHEVLGIPVPPVTQVTKEAADKINKPLDDCDMVIVSGPEWLRKWIKAFYPDWDKLKCPRVGWYHESFIREDFTLDYGNFESMFDFHFFPDRADAEKYKGTWLPLGVDIEIFNNRQVEGFYQPRDIEIGFIGLMYPKRQRFVDELTPHLGDIKIKYMTGFHSERGLIPAIAAYGPDGMDVRRSMHLLAEAYRRIKIFVTFPSLSNVLVAKVLESLACGCQLVAPRQPADIHGYFPYEGAYQCAERIREAMKIPFSQNDIHCHRMENRFAEIFEKVGLCITS